MKNRIFCIAMLFGMLFTLNLTAQNLLQGKRIFLDPGHDGFGSGDRNIATINFPVETSSGLGNDGFYESRKNVWRGLETQRLLESQGAIVGLSRTTTPQPVALSARPGLANTFNADVYISIHSNAFGQMINRPRVYRRETGIHADAHRLALAMVWWLADNPVTSWSEVNVNRTNVGVSNLGAIATSQMPAALTEDTFHDYLPETHRYLSMTYNHKISFNHLRGILRFFDINPELHPTGLIVGWVKDDTRSITANFPVNGHRYLPFRPGSHDSFWPINGATVELLQDGNVIDSYTVDNNWNGIFGFMDLAPGNYQVRFIAEGYVTETQDVVVTAGNITAANQILALCDPNDVNCVQLFPPLRLVMGTEATAPFGTHVTTADLGTTTHLYLGIDQNNDAGNPSWINPATTTLTSSDRNIAAIDANGVIELRRSGTTVIRVVRSSDGAHGEITLTLTGANPFCLDFTDPPSDGSFGLAASYEFAQVGTTTTIDLLAGLTVRRSILRDGKLYVLAAEADRSPRLLVINPETGALITEMSTNGILPHTNQANSAYLFTLSDIGFTADGVLIGTNSTVVGAAGNIHLAGDFIVYKWQATETVALEDAEPEILLQFPMNSPEGVGLVGNNLSNFVANSIAVSGCIDNMRLYFTSLPGRSWGAQGNFNLLVMCWVIEDGVRVASNRNNTQWMIVPDDGESIQLHLSPLGLDRYVISGRAFQPRETQFDWTPWVTGVGEPRGVVTPFAGDIPRPSIGATYFRYAGRSLMVSPIAERQSDDTYSFKARLFDITDGFNRVKLLGETPVGITDVPAGVRMTAAAEVDNADIYIYLMAGNQIAKFEISDFTSGGARIFAYNLVSEYNVASNGYDISFDLNYDANSVEIILTEVDTKAEVIIPLGSLAQGNHQIVLLNTQIPEDGTFNWAIRASADPVARIAQMSSRTFTRPRTVAIDNSPESPYFGRVYVGNSNHTATPANQVGIFVLSPTGEDVTGQGNVAHAGTGMGWAAAANEENFRKLAVAEDGRVFIADQSIANSGIYIMNPSTFEMSQMFTPARNAAGRFYAGTTYIGGRTSAVGVRGSGANTRLYTTVGNLVPGTTWRQHTHIYNIGDASTWSVAPNFARETTTVNINNSIVPTAEGFWVGQFRGSSVNNVQAEPYMYFFSREADAVTFHTAAFRDASGGNFAWPDWSSAHGALAVNEQERLVALSLNGGVQFFSYEFPPFSDGVPTVRMLHQHALGGAHEDFEFDFAGNLYTVSAGTGAVRVWAIPTSNNTKVTPARSSMLIERGGDIQLPVREYSAEICEGETYSDETFTGLTTPGIHQYVTADSIIRLNLTVHPVYAEMPELVICENELPFTWRGNIIPVGTTSGPIVFDETTIHGCDSIVTLNLTVHPTELHEYSAEINEGESFTDDNFTGLTTPGIHELVLQTEHGCDSVIRLTLEVKTGLTVTLENAIQLYPIPVRHELRIAINGDITIKALEIVDVSGRSVQMFITPARQVDVSTLPQGVYFARIETDKGIVVKRFVKE